MKTEYKWIAAKHTPGPWLTYGNSIVADDKLCPGYTVCVAMITHPNDNVKHPVEETQANAQLIASAPQLLEALKYFVVRHNPDDCPAYLNPAVKKARQAIADATKGGMK